MADQDNHTNWIPRLNTRNDELLAEFKGVLVDPKMADQILNATGSLTLLADGRSLIWGEANGRLSRIDLETGAVLWSVEGAHKPILQSVVLSNDATFTATAGDDDRVCFWDNASGTSLAVFEHPRPIPDVAFHENKMAVACGDNVYIWNTTTREQVICRGHDALVESVTWSPDGSQVVSGACDQTLILWDAADGSKKQQFYFGTRVLSVEWSPKSDLLAAGGDGRVRIFKGFGSEPLFTMHRHTDEVNRVRWNSSGRFLATSCCDKTLRIWDGTLGKELHRFKVEEGYVWDISWSPNDAFIAITVSGDVARLLDVRPWVFS